MQYIITESETKKRDRDSQLARDKDEPRGVQPKTSNWLKFYVSADFRMSYSFALRERHFPD